ncbi:hypothetical protein LWF15_02745 [Kineosporia rhizophila]|uniref:FliH/SctL family protein n=1 Tax=Kineosporia TaxID=49184 RepID=UPI001E4F1C84|nr:MULTISPECIES: FliH/SctL family protein [Kineosporia]MCE0534416.1 hypothetical protein [Kineosporia rhizophila]GLY13950.1 hypothetical protein Kisp01_09660 [Kineosporia sp. NBRC 101677]
MTSRTGSSPVLSGAEAQAAVRPANLDRPLHRGTIDPQYSDPRLEEMIRATAERAREEAQAQGYLAGWSQGRQAAAEENVRVQARLQEENQKLRAQLTVEAQQLLENLRDATRQVQQATLPQWNEVSDILTDGALRLAEAALGRELQTMDDSVTSAVQAALRQVAASEETEVHLHPSDAEVLAEDAVEGVTIVPDPAVPAGAVTVLTPTQRLRHDLPGALSAAEEVLRS